MSLRESTGVERDAFGAMLGAGRPEPVRRGRRRRWLVALAVVAVLLVVGAGGAWYVVRSTIAGLDAKVERFASPFAALPETQRAAADPAAAGAVNLLLLGSDSRVSAGDPTRWTAGAQRTDAIMVVHLARDRRSAAVVSIPRDSWVPIPGYGTAKVNAAFSHGGPTLMVRTVEQLTGLRMDHVAIVDFDGFRRVTDELGGVTITVPKDTKDMRAKFTAGTHRMDGATALDYVRQRYDLPGGDFDRVKRQQNWLRAILKQVRAQGVLKDPTRTLATLDALSTSLATDAGFTAEQMQEMLTSLHGLRTSDIAFLTARVKGTGTSRDGQSIVLLDAARGRTLWTALRGDRMTDWITRYRPDLLPATVR